MSSPESLLTEPRGRPVRYVMGAVGVVAFLVILLAGTAAIWWYGRFLPATTQLTLGWMWLAAMLLALAVLLRRLWDRLFGPVFLYDLIRTARRGTAVAHRFLYACFLIFAFVLVYTHWFPQATLADPFPSMRMQRSDMPRFAGSFFMSIMSVQFLAVLVVTPAYTAGAVAEEKQRRTLEYLLATDLTNWEVVLGLMGSRLANLFLLLLTGLPVLCVIQFLGGVDPNAVLAGFAVTLMTMLSLGALCIAASVYAARPLDALVWSYVLAFMFEGLPIMLSLGMLGGSWQNADDYTQVLAPLFLMALYHGAVTLFAGGLAVKYLRHAYLGTEQAPVQPVRPVVPPKPRKQERPRRPRAQAAKTTDGWGPYAESDAILDVLPVDDPPARPVPLPVPDPPPMRRHTRPSNRPRVGSDSMVWKELGANLNLGFLLAPVTRLFLVCVVLLFLAALGVSILLEPVEGSMSHDLLNLAELRKLPNGLVRGVGTLVMCLTLLFVALGSSNRITREQEQQTLDTLLTVPLSNADILIPKFLGSIWDTRWNWFLLLPLWGLGLITGGLHVVALPLLIGAYLVYTVCLSTLGLWLSTISGTTLRATLLTLLAAMVVIAGPGILVRTMTGEAIRAVGMSTEITWETLFSDQALTPPMNLWMLAFHGGDLVGHNATLSMINVLSALVGLLLYLAATALMWFSMLTRLRGERLTHYQRK